MVKIALGGLCQCCGRYSPGLYTCKACGSRCCLGCIDSKTGFCKLCGGIRRLKRGRGKIGEHLK